MRRAELLRRAPHHLRRPAPRARFGRRARRRAHRGRDVHEHVVRRHHLPRPHAEWLSAAGRGRAREVCPHLLAQCWRTLDRGQEHRWHGRAASARTRAHACPDTIPRGGGGRFSGARRTTLPTRRERIARRLPRRAESTTRRISLSQDRSVMTSIHSQASTPHRHSVTRRALGIWGALGVATLLAAIAPAALLAQSEPTATCAATARRLSIDEALRMAETQSEAVQIARAGVTRATGQQYQARSQYLPPLN